MGVHGLWDLLAPVGRRVSVETLAGKRLAIDASIWMIQFMKAMRDERGEMVRNAHLIGFFRRICKLLFLRTKPVFVFDGGTPALKRRTVIARRRQRENAQAKIRKTAEKLFFNHVKAMKLKELADTLQDQKDNKCSKGKEVLLDQSDTSEKNKAALEGHNQEMIDEMLAASIIAEESGELGSGLSCTAEIGSSSGNASAYATEFPKEDEDVEDDEEMILSITDGDVDPAVLASLPPSMQLDLLVQMRERLMAENRQKYQKVEKAPQKFSELQIEAYLKTVAFRREIDQVQRAASGKGVGGVQTSRIASESNKEFIFSSSFSGDKQLLAAGGAENFSVKQSTIGKKDSSFNILNFMSSTNKSDTEAGSDAGDAVQTFLDAKQHKCASRGRAMGIRMTRDLQRNIDLLKELEQERTTASTEANAHPCSVMDINSGKPLHDGKSFEAVKEYNYDKNSSMNSSSEPENHDGTLNSETCINISFDDDGMHNSLDVDDEFFAHLVAGNKAPICSAEYSTYECDWEDGMIDGECGSSINGNKLETISCHAQDENKDESDVEWEEGSSLISNKSNMKSFDEEESKSAQKIVSKGSAEEEASLQEAIRRSLEDFPAKETSYACLVELGSENCRPVPSSRVERVLDEIQQSQSTIDGPGQPNFLAGKDTYALKSDGTNSTATASFSDRSATCLATKNHLEQQASTSIETNETSDLKCGSSAPTSIVACISSGTVPKNVADNLTTDKVVNASIPREVNEKSVGQMSSALEGPTLQERSYEDNILEPLGSSLQEELLMLDQEYKCLGDEQKKLERNADFANADMFVECQELLQMFGLPYIIAPMEAEAQCAYMELVDLVDGVVTDDSDVFLFGGQSVYKNIFDERKYVETYLMKDIESELGLNREKLIRMALLLGSDYTEGISGIGIVNAIEVVNAFPEEDGLCKFREWIESPDPAILGKIGLQPGLGSKKKGSKASKKGMNNSESDTKGNSAADPDTVLENKDNDAVGDISSMKLAFMNKHRNVSKNWHIPASFPSDAVISAYEAPQVDKSTEPFAWGKPDIFSLRRLCWEKFAWSSQKADELLLPVLKEYNKHETQLRLEAFYTFNERFAKIRSKRIQKAVKGITGKKTFDEADDLLENPANKKTKTPGNGDKREKRLPKRKNNVAEKRNLAKKVKSQQETEVEVELSTEVGSRREREIKRQRGKAVGRAKQKGSSDSELNETSSSNYKSSDEHEHELLAENREFAHSVRRSKRARNAANYVEEDEESTLVIPKNSMSKKCDDVADEQKSSRSPSFDKIDACAESDLPEQGDYLIKGGGFCAEGEESNKVDAIQRDSNSDYLEMGGGFCLDDEDQEGDSHGDGASDPSVNVVGQSSVLDTLQKGDVSNLKPNLGDQPHETTDPSYVNPFSAIPYLKKKKT